jgi:hypothetical protein
MSRRHNAARRRNYGRRQHEVRERRTDTRQVGDWQGQVNGNEVALNNDWRVTDIEDERPPAAGPEGYGGAHP